MKDDRDYQDELTLGRLAVSLGFCTEKQIKEAVKEQRHREVQGKFDHLGSILVEKGFLVESQVGRMLQVQKQTGEKRQIAGYEIVSEIGRGAAGIVYKARQLSLDREIALKVMPKGTQANKEFRTRFLREARVAARLSHPNIIRAIDAGESRESFYFAMELFEAPDLRKVLKARGTLLEAEVVKIGIQVARALQNAHENELVHRDIKPENLLMREDTGLVKLTDLGLARSTSRDEKRLTQDGTTMGTPYYMSPEAVRGNLEIDIRADINSLGATMYHLATGQVPFEADNVFLVLRRHLEDPLDPPRHVNPGLSEAFNRIIVKTMQKDPDRRYESPEDLLADLETLDRVGPVKAEGLVGDAPARPAPHRRRPAAASVGRRWFPLVAALGALALAAAAVVAVLSSGIGGGKGGTGDAGRDGGTESGGGGREPKGDPSEKPVPPVPEPSGKGTGKPAPLRDEEVAAEKAFAEAEAFARANPDRPVDVAARFEAVGREHSPVREACERARDRWRERALEIDLKALFAEVESLAAGRKFGPAVRLLHEFPLSHHVSADVENDLKKKTDRLLAQAETEAKVLERKAARLEAKRDPAGAIRALEEIRAFEVPVLGLQAEKEIRRLREAVARMARVRAHAAALDEAAASGLRAAAERLPAGAAGSAEDKEFLRLAAEALDAAARGAESRKGQPFSLRLRDGSVALGSLAGATPADLLVEDARKIPQPVPWARVAVESVSELGGDAVSGLQLACLAWCFHRDFEAALELLSSAGGGGGKAEALRALIEPCLDLEIAEGLESVRTALEGGLRPDALRMLRALLLRFRDTRPYRDLEGEFRELFAQAAGPGSPESMGPFLFRGAMSIDGGAWRVEYGFGRPNQLQDLEGSGAAVFVAREGRIQQNDPNPASAALALPGLWASLDVELEAEIPEDGGFGVSLAPAQGDRFVLALRRSAGELWARFWKVPASGDPVAVGKTVRVRAGPGQFRVRASLARDGARGAVEGAEELRVPAAPAFPCRAALEAAGRFSVSRLALRGEPERSWIDDAARWEKCRVRFLSGEWTELLRESPLSQWKREGGRTALAEGIFSIDAVTDTSRNWLPGAGGLVRDGRGVSVAVELRRLSDAGWFFVSFLVDGRPIAWILTPERDETRPAGAPKDHALLSTVPFPDRQWHTVHLEIKEDQAAVFVDGEAREMFQTSDLRDLDSGALKAQGLGFGALGGKWEVRAFKLGRAGK